MNPVLSRQMKAHLAGIVARRVAAVLHIAPAPATVVINMPPPLPHSTSLIQLSSNYQQPRQSVGSGVASMGLIHTNSVPMLSPQHSPRSPKGRRPSVPSSSSPTLAYPDATVQTPPLPLNAEEELIQCTFILYVMLDAVHNKMRSDDSVLRQLYSILPELYHLHSLFDIPKTLQDILC